jgi:hypothetical protein
MALFFPAPPPSEEGRYIQEEVDCSDEQGWQHKYK